MRETETERRGETETKRGGRGGERQRETKKSRDKINKKRRVHPRARGDEAARQPLALKEMTL